MKCVTINLVSNCTLHCTQKNKSMTYRVRICCSFSEIENATYSDVYRYEPTAMEERDAPRRSKQQALNLQADQLDWQQRDGDTNQLEAPWGTKGQCPLRGQVKGLALFQSYLGIVARYLARCHGQRLSGTGNSRPAKMRFAGMESTALERVLQLQESPVLAVP
jgi:hypothetical protein